MVVPSLLTLGVVAVLSVKPLYLWLRTGASRFLIGLVTCFTTHEGISSVPLATCRR
jgi:hypothetical protein